MTRLDARWPLVALSAASAAAMLYVGAYQTRAVDHLACPAFGHGCEAVADAPFAHPFGVPDGYVAAAMYLVLVALAALPSRSRGVVRATRAVAWAALATNVLGLVDMARFGQLCFWCALTALLAVPIVRLASP